MYDSIIKVYIINIEVKSLENQGNRTKEKINVNTIIGGISLFISVLGLFF